MQDINISPPCFMFVVRSVLVADEEGDDDEDGGGGLCKS